MALTALHSAHHAHWSDALSHLLEKHHAHLTRGGIGALVLGLGFAGVLLSVHFFGAAVLAAIVAILVSRATADRD